jgi:hypothetical protein
LSSCLEYALRESIAEIQPGEAGFAGGCDGAGISEIARRPNVQTQGWWLL